VNEEVLFRLLGQQARGPAANAQQAAYHNFLSQQFAGQPATPPGAIEMVRDRDGIYRAWWEGDDWRLRERVYRA